MRLFGATASSATFFLLILFAKASESRKMIDDDCEDDPVIPRVNRTDLESSWFFNIGDLRAGKRMAVHFAKKEESIHNKFLPREEADLIPFSLEELPEVLKLLDYAQGSPQATAVEATLRACSRPPASETFKACFTSYESMLDSVMAVFNISESSRRRPAPLTTVFCGSHRRSFQNYTILEEPREVPASNMMGCHALPYPYVLFYCHRQPGTTKVFRVLLGGENGDVVDAVAACHLDTSLWDSDTLPFRALGTRPGDPVCHFFPPHGNIAWVHTTSSASAVLRCLALAT